MKRKKEPMWIAREYTNCSGCRKCEIACSLFHEKSIWPEASRVRVFMLVPGAEFPHMCAQCENYPCVKACPASALSVSQYTGAILVNNKACTACGKCIAACPGKVPHMHPTEKHILICDLCGGNPQCVKVCREGGWNVFKKVTRGDRTYSLYARNPEEVTRDLCAKFYGEKGEEFV